MSEKTLFVRFVVTLDRRQLFFTSSQVSRTPTRSSSVRSSILRICTYQTLKDILQTICCDCPVAPGVPILADGDPGERKLPILVGEDEVPNGNSPAESALPPSVLVVPSIAYVFAGLIPLSIRLKHVRHWVD